MTETLTHILSRNLVAAMAAADDGIGISQARLSRLSGVAQSTISLVVNPDQRFAPTGRAASSPTVERIGMLAQALGVEPWQLLHPSITFKPAHRIGQHREKVTE